MCVCVCVSALVSCSLSESLDVDGKWTRRVIAGMCCCCRKGDDAGDHPPNTPVRGASRGDMRESDQWRLYEYICEHFLASISADCRYQVHAMRFDVGAERFSHSTRTVVDPGYTAVMSSQAVDKTGAGSVLAEGLQNMKRGERLRVADARLDERQTQPPHYLTEAELITLMEKHGIGTDASIPTHIKNICTRNYVTVGDGRKLHPTPLGVLSIQYTVQYTLYSTVHCTV